MTEFLQSELPGMPTPVGGRTAEAQPPKLKRSDVPDALWPTDNDCDIPLLNTYMEADAIDLPVVAWGSLRRKDRMCGTWHFYVDDRRFRALWDDPSPVVNSACRTVVEPNFSCHDQLPVAVGLYWIYQKRWLARYWQSKGIRVLVDLNVSEKFHRLNMLGVPVGWRAYATRGYADLTDLTVREWELACQRARTDDLLFLVYGGGKKVQQLCRDRGWIRIPERADVVKSVHKEARHGGRGEGGEGGEGGGEEEEKEGDSPSIEEDHQ
jgi:hypothetical protein